MAAMIGWYIVNFFVIFASISLFFAPFVLIFYIRRRSHIDEARPHFNYFMEQFFRSRESNALVVVWAAAEALVWFVIPEFLLILLIFMKVQRKRELVMYDIIGTIIGTIIAISLHLQPALLVELPYVYERMIGLVQGWYEQWGMLGIFFQPFSGVPYKVFNAVAGDFHFFIPVFLVLAVIARMIRYVIVYEITKAIYPFVHHYVRKHYGYLFVAAIAIFTILLLQVSSHYS